MGEECEAREGHEEMRFDDLRTGNLQVGIMYHVFGHAGAGKTTLAMMITSSILEHGGTCAWFDTKNTFSPRRFKDISTMNAGLDLSSKVRLLRPRTVEGLEFGLINLVSNAREWSVKLVVLDTIFGCLDIRSENVLKRQREWRYAEDVIITLYMLTSGSKIPALVLNDMSYNPALGMDRPVGEYLVKKLVNETVFLKRKRTSTSSETLECITDDGITPFSIYDGGIVAMETCLD
ncbi:MAG: hypothetical protein ACFFCS_12190 [Candidatus Hodarchaeota archaeon]